MRIENIPLNADWNRLGVINPDEVSLTGYLVENFTGFRTNDIRPAVIICPGGGYSGYTESEGAPIAAALSGMGISALILRYSLCPVRHPAQLGELFAALEVVHRYAGEWNIDPEQIYVMGFSAGGHLAGMAGVLWNSEFAAGLGYEPENLCPAGMLLGYPVISADPACGHQGSFLNLLGETGDAFRKALSLERLVTPDTCPAFLFHTRDDSVVPVRHTLAMAAALEEQGVPFELHIYNSGFHGMGLADERTAWSPEIIRPHCADWLVKAVEWIRECPRFRGRIPSPASGC